MVRKKINEFVQNNFLKKRIIFKSINAINTKNAKYKIVEISASLVSEYRESLEKLISLEKLYSRLKCKDITGFAVLNKEQNEIVGFQWLIYSSEEYIHDNFKIPPYTAFLFHAYILEKYRGQGLFKLLKSYIINHHYSNNGGFELYSVVESLNYQSYKANLKLGSKIVGANYLVKIFGRNIIVINQGEEGITVFFATRNRI